jgi:hypothetical protein
MSDLNALLDDDDDILGDLDYEDDEDQPELAQPEPFLKDPELETKKSAEPEKRPSKRGRQVEVDSEEEGEVSEDEGGGILIATFLPKILIPPMFSPTNLS